MPEFKKGDRVRLFGGSYVSTIDEIIGDTALIRYPSGKQKVKVGLLEIVEDEVTITAKDYDEAVRGILEGISREADESDDNVGALMSLVVSITEDLKQRLFKGGD